MNGEGLKNGNVKLRYISLSYFGNLCFFAKLKRVWLWSFLSGISLINSCAHADQAIVTHEAPRSDGGACERQLESGDMHPFGKEKAVAMDLCLSLATRKLACSGGEASYLSCQEASLELGRHLIRPIYDFDDLSDIEHEVYNSILSSQNFFLAEPSGILQYSNCISKSRLDMCQHILIEFKLLLNSIRKEDQTVLSSWASKTREAAL